MCNLSSGIEARGVEKIALKMLKESEPLKKITDYTELTVERIKELAARNGYSICVDR